MATKGNERILTFATVTEVTGTEEHEQLTEIEIIFGHYEDIDAHALRRCSNLHKLTLLNCRLQRIPVLPLCAVRDSLVHLCLSSQQITRMEPLDLPQLRSLYLQQNRIERIEGLDNCRHLRALWLYGNCIRRIENLSFCTDLRELWLQDNAIGTLAATSQDAALGDLVHLETLCLAKNRLRNIDELHALANNHINLRSLSFADDHFGSNPIVRHPEYRGTAIAMIRQLQSLDGVAIDKTQRAVAVDTFLSQALEFNDRIADLTLQYDQDLRAIQTREERSASNAQMIQRELVEALNDVEKCVVRGSRELEHHKQWQIALREQHVALTTQAMEKIHCESRHQLEQRLASELKKLDEEEVYYQVVEQEAMAEHSITLTLTTLQCTVSEIAFETLAEHSPDFQFIATRFGQDQDDGREPAKYAILRVYRFFHGDLVRQFEKELTSSGGGQGTSRDDEPHPPPPGEGAVLYLYCAVDEDQVMGILHDGFATTNEDDTLKWLVLFQDPIQALAFDPGTDPSPSPSVTSAASDGDSDGPEFVPKRIKSHLLLLCRVYMAQINQVTIGDRTLEDAISLDSIVSLATAGAAVLVTRGDKEEASRPPSFIHTVLQNSEMYLTSRATCGSIVVPEFVVLCSQRLVSVVPPVDDDDGEEGEDVDGTTSPEQVLIQFYSKMDHEVRRHRDHLWKEIDPAVFAKKNQFQNELQEVDREAVHIKQRIKEEKKTQKQLLKKPSARSSRR